MNLGDRLKANNERIERMRVAAEIEKKILEERKFDENRAKINNFVDITIDAIERKIMDNGVPKGYKIPKGEPWNTNGWVESNGSFRMVTHPFYIYIERLFDWAKENGLEGHITNCHDGMGMDSWFEFSVTTKKNNPFDAIR